MELRFTLGQRQTCWSIMVHADSELYSVFNQYSFEVRIRYDHAPTQEVRLFAWEDGDAFEVVTKKQFGALVDQVVGNEGVTHEEAVEALHEAKRYLIADAYGIPMQTIIIEALKRWEAIKLLVTPEIAS